MAEKWPTGPARVTMGMIVNERKENKKRGEKLTGVCGDGRQKCKVGRVRLSSITQTERERQKVSPH